MGSSLSTIRGLAFSRAPELRYDRARRRPDSVRIRGRQSEFDKQRSSCTDVPLADHLPPHCGGSPRPDLDEFSDLQSRPTMLREPHIKKTVQGLPPWGLREQPSRRFQTRSSYFPTEKCVSCSILEPNRLREQPTSSTPVLLMVGRDCMMSDEEVDVLTLRDVTAELATHARPAT